MGDPTSRHTCWETARELDEGLAVLRSKSQKTSFFHPDLRPLRDNTSQEVDANPMSTKPKLL